MTLEVDLRVRRDGFEVAAAFRAAAGETVALLGPNGSGKTTLVLALAGLVEPEEGTIELDGEPLGSLAPQERPIGVVFQELLLFPHLSALENVAFPMRARGVPKQEARQRARSWLERLGIPERAAARPGDLSGGEAQRVALARALVHEPRLLLLDEPLSALDVQARGRIRDLVKRTLREFDGVRLLVTHDAVEAMTVADRLVLIERGRITQQGTPEQVRDAPRTSYAADLVGVNLFSGRLEPLEAGAGRIATTDGDVIVAWPPDAKGPTDGVLGLVRPADVSLHIARPEGSARNVVRGEVASISLEGERARVRLASRPQVVAEVTPGSIERLGIDEGVEIWASFKAVEVRVVLP